MKKIFPIVLAVLFSALLKAQVTGGLQLQYTFEGDASNASLVHDDTGNGYNGFLFSGASLVKLKDFNVLALGAQNGYLDMGKKTGDLIASLGDFSIATYLYIEPSSNITGNGNFVWAFSTDSACTQTTGKYIAYRVNAQRYAQSTGGWASEAVVVQKNTVATKGVWQHVVYTQSGTSGTLYLNGAVYATGASSLKPSAIGQSTVCNWIGRSPFTTDVYLIGAWLSDFRIYNRALTAAEVTQLAANSSALNTEYSEKIVQDAYDALDLGNTSEVIANLQLPSILNNVNITWESSDTNHLTNAGGVTRPAQGGEPVTVQLTATLSFNGATLQKTFDVTIMPQLDDAASVASDLEAIVVNSGCYQLQTIPLPSRGAEGSTISWSSDNTDYVGNDGQVKKVPPKGEGNLDVKLTATVQKGNVIQTKDFTVCIKEDEGLSAYLFVYFAGNTGDQEAIRFAISRDGYHYQALNSNQPIISSASISSSGGIRDPHILRSPDGSAFYMAATDMKSSLGWDSNHGIVMLKSPDLINWTSSKIDIRATYPEFNNITRAWAPETFYDAVTQKYMVYFSMNSPTMGYDIIHYAYANPDFTALESTPKVLFYHPQKQSCIDGDITLKDGIYNLFFKTEGNGNGIMKAVSDNLTTGYVLQNKYLQQTTEASEGSCVFKLINQEKYIFMYDLYNNGAYQFTESTDLENFTVIDDKVSLDFSPRHGTVIPISEADGERLMQAWGQSVTLKIVASQSPAVKQQNLTINETASAIFLPVKDKTDLSAFDPEFSVLPGVTLTPDTPQDFTKGAVTYTLSFGGRQRVYTVTAQVDNNPVLNGFYADPQVLYSQKTNKYYIYPTTDGFPNWGGYSFNAFSSDDLANWTNDGTILDLSTGQVSWANGNAWAPTIAEKMIDGNYKYFLYFSGNAINGSGKQIGVATADDPSGPFTDSGKAMIASSPTGSGQQIDPCFFSDPVSGKNYIYWGNGYLAVAELNDDMISVKAGTIKVITPSGGTTANYAYREGSYVFYRNGLYYFLWSVDDTGVANYHVAYGTSTSPLGPITIAANPIVIIQDPANKIYGTGHNSVLQIPGRDEWYIVYHRINAAYLNNNPGYHREVCIDKMEFNADGTIKQVKPTLTGVNLNNETAIPRVNVSSRQLMIYPNPARSIIHIQVSGETSGNYIITIYSLTGEAMKKQIVASPNEMTVSVSQLPKGIYLLSVQNSDSFYRNKFVKY